MTLTRRSFLKAAGLTVVAAAGASMFTGCSTFVNPEITVIYQEVDAANTSKNAVVITTGLKDWSEGKKTFTENSSLIDIKDDTKDVSIEDAKKVLFQHLVDDNYKGAIGDIKIIPENAGDTTIKYTKKDAAHYEMSVKFCKA